MLTWPKIERKRGETHKKIKSQLQKWFLPSKNIPKMMNSNKN